MCKGAVLMQNTPRYVLGLLTSMKRDIVRKGWAGRSQQVLKTCQERRMGEVIEEVKRDTSGSFGNQVGARATALSIKTI
jgi:hypothetical protein